jgi:hypothetical protein
MDPRRKGDMLISDLVMKCVYMLCGIVKRFDCCLLGVALVGILCYLCINYATPSITFKTFLQIVYKIVKAYDEPPIADFLPTQPTTTDQCDY